MPVAWRPVAADSRIAVGHWVPKSSIRRCAACGTLWYVAFDPKDLYYRVHPLEPGLEALLPRQGRLDSVWPVLFAEGDEGLVAAWFGSARYDPQEAVDGLLERLGAADLTAERAERLLTCLAALLGNRNPHHRARLRAKGPPLATIPDARVLTNLLGRDGPFRGEAEGADREERLRALLQRIVAAAFEEGFEGAPLLEVDGASRARLVGEAGRGSRVHRVLLDIQRAVSRLDRKLLQPRGQLANPLGALQEGHESLRSLLRDGALPLHAHGVRTLLEATEALDRAASSDGPTAPDPMLVSVREIGRRYRALLAELLRCGGVPEECEAAVAALAGAPIPRRPAAVAPIAPEAGEPIEPSGGGPLRLLVLLAVGALVVLVDGCAMGLLAVPAAGGLFSTANVAVLAVSVGLALFLLPPHSLHASRAFAAAVAVGTILWAHHVAYEWDAKPWARRYWIAKQGEAAVEGVGSDELLTRFIRDVLGEPDAGGKWDMLRVRALYGEDLGVREAVLSNRSKDRRVRGAAVWRKWAWDAALIALGAWAGLRISRMR